MGLKVLLIDDDPDILTSTSSLLRKKNYEVFEAESGEDALEILKDRRPDFVVTDVLLPQMNGYELVKQIRENPRMSDIPVLVITGRGQMKETFDLLDVDGFISKPFLPETLFHKIEEIRSIREAAQSELGQCRRKILVLGREDASDVLKEMDTALRRLGHQVMCEISTGDAVAKAVEFRPDIFVVDVQLDGKHSAEFVNIIRHLPQYEEVPIAGFCYYRLTSLGEDEARKQVMKIQEDADKFLAAGGTSYMGRYSPEILLAALKDIVFQDGNYV